MEKARLSILIARIKSQVSNIEKLFSKVEERKTPKSSKAYTSELDERKLRLVLEDALMLKDKYRQDIAPFIRKLKSSVNEEDPEY
ncbi:MAG TPA: hypothetical protein DCE07_08330 [Peptococcaceae bacterium]|nr:hypothetical protein [Peptococcaceae bacterium]